MEMTREEARLEIRRQWRPLIATMTKPAKKRINGETSYICPICGNGSGTDGTGITFDPSSKDGNTLHCFKAGCDFESGDIIDLYMQVNNVDYSTALHNLAEYLNITIMPYDQSQSRRPSAKMDDKEAGCADVSQKAVHEEIVNQPEQGLYRDYIDKCVSAVDKTSYLHERGFTDATIKRFLLGYDDNKGTITIPYGQNCSYYISRSVEEKTYRKPSREEAGEEPVYNAAALYGNQPCFICEGQFDAISIMQVGGCAVAVGGAGVKKLLALLDNKKPERKLILCFDQDKPNLYGKRPGQEMQKALAEELAKRKIQFCEARFIYEKYGDKPKKDPNDLLRANNTEFAKDVYRNIIAAQRDENFITYNVGDYLRYGGYDADVDYFKQYKKRKTGFSNLDRYLTLYPGLTALGGASSLGKTTFAVNLAANLLQAGETIIYFALEQGPIELVTKMLARKLLAKDPNSHITNIDIKNGATSDALIETRSECADLARNFYIVRCDFVMNADKIKEYVEDFIKRTKTRPVVFIDYLQIIGTPDGIRADNERIALDYDMKLFKTMQIKNELLVILINSFNRGSYNVPVSYEAFRGTSLVEFTCDYVWGLELSVMDSDDYYMGMDEMGNLKDTNAKMKNDLLYEATSSLVKDITFVSLKNRNGKQSFKCYFKYDMEYDSYVPDYKREGYSDTDNMLDNESDMNGFHMVGSGFPAFFDLK